MSLLTEKLLEVSWPKAAVGMVLTCLLSLSVHVVMLQVFRVPYPAGYPSGGWPAFISVAFSIVGIASFYEVTSAGRSPVARPVPLLLLFVLVAMLRESLRLPIMDGFATTAWRYSLVSDTPRIIMVFLICCTVVATPKISRWWVKAVAAVFSAAVLQFIIQPLIHAGFSQLLTSIAYLSHDEIYKVPYGWQIEVPAYITYLEPVIGCFLMAIIAWEKLAGNMLQRTVQFILLVMLIGNALIRPFIYAFYSEFTPVVSLLSMGQFFLETFFLALLTTLNVRWSTRKRALNSYMR